MIVRRRMMTGLLLALLLMGVAPHGPAAASSPAAADPATAPVELVAGEPAGLPAFIDWGDTLCSVVPACVIGRIGTTALSRVAAEFPDASPTELLSLASAAAPQATASVLGSVVTDFATNTALQAFTNLLFSVTTGLLEGFLAVLAWVMTLWLQVTLNPYDITRTLDSGLTGLIGTFAAFVMTLVIYLTAMSAMYRRDGGILADGMAGLFKAVLVLTMGPLTVGALWVFADAMTAAIMPGGHNIVANWGTSLTLFITGLNPATAIPQLLIFLVLLFLALLSSLGLLLMMLFRIASVAVLTLLLPVVAAGAPGTATRAWLPKVGGWLLALIAFKPLAALILRIGFEVMSVGGDGAQTPLSQQLAASGLDTDSGVFNVIMTMLTGLMMVLGAMFALPALMRLTSWMFGGGSGGGSMLATGMAAATLGMYGRSMMRGRGSAGGPQPGGGGPDEGGSPGPGGPSDGGRLAAQQQSIDQGTGSPRASQPGSPLSPAPSPGPVPSAGASGSGGAAAAGGGAAAGAGGGAAAGAGGGAAAGAGAGAAGGPPGMAVGAVVGGTLDVAGKGITAVKTATSRAVEEGA